jgi:hypothetical protein
MLVEYHLPLTSQRADVVLAGTHPRTGEASYVVVESRRFGSFALTRCSPRAGRIYPVRVRSPP